MTMTTRPYRLMTHPTRARHRPAARPLHQVLPPRSMLLLAALTTVLVLLLVAAG